jgi:hypothetical protein
MKLGFNFSPGSSIEFDPARSVLNGIFTLLLGMILLKGKHGNEPFLGTEIYG